MALTQTGTPSRADRLLAKATQYNKSHSIAGYTTQTLANMARQVDFEDARVLEFGGWNIPTDITLGDLGARSWLSVDMIGSLSGTYQQKRFSHLKDIEIFDYVQGADRIERDGFTVVDGDATMLPEPYFGKFDIVVTIATIEHVLDMVTFLEKAWRALKPGGTLVTRFGPVWASHIGHHAFVSPEINFQKPEGPIGPWGHLLHRPGDMQDILSKAGEPGNVIARTIHQLYTSPRINRLFNEDYHALFANSRFDETTWTPCWGKKPDQDMFDRLRLAHPHAHDFSTGAWETVSRKG
ncbi:class I SAM-dependent methyltransferase [Pukyongiella litopenaei]|uniref:Class I SAM-dependent methyltransferase n=1 Tax=Pukyongiella litopenaei TaxID=2605946 RepID=A0A2S0MSG7_9RHOB|nr:class I SAM-dependent methyltransferase [Pukyongiella litopenaei]AVO38681.1 class I SAM-dependent methyltransferase [Pukyongiella litopenaei]